MNYSLEISGTVTYADNTERSFLATTDDKASLAVTDQLALNDSIQTVRDMLSSVDTTHYFLSQPANPLVTSIVIEINCLYTIGESTYSISLVSNSDTGLLVVGNTSWNHFLSNNLVPFETLLRSLYRGCTVVPGLLVDPVYFKIVNDSDYSGPITFRIYSEVNFGVGPEIFRRDFDSLNSVFGFIFNRSNTNNRFWCSAVRFGEPAPTPMIINTQMNVFGIASSDLVIADGLNSPFQFTLANVVF